MIAPLLLMTAAVTTDPTAKVAGFHYYATANNWIISQSLGDDTCTASTRYESGAYLTIHWRPRNHKTYIFYEDARMASIEDGKTYTIKVSFLKGKELDDGWGERTATGGKSIDQVPDIAFLLPGEEAMDDLAQSNLLGLWYKDNIVASLDLSHSALMVQQLRKCQVDILKNHPLDPFED